MDIMSSHESSFMEESRIEFENTPVRVIPTRDLDELSLGERKIGPFTSGREVEIPFWMAEELAKAGLVKFRDEYMVDLAAL